MTPEFEYLQVKWAAHLSYAAATALLSEILPIADTISVSGVQRRVRVVGAALEHESSGMGDGDRVTIFTEGAGEFEKAVNGASRPTCRILDWFHIA